MTRRNESNSVGTFTVDVKVTPVDETPEITTTGATHATPSFAEIEYDATTADLTVADYDARDEERETITWGLGGPDMIDFTIDSTTGFLSFAIGADAIGPDYEISHDSSPHDNVYTIIVKATDASPTRKAREYPVNVTVTDVNETPEVTLLRGDSAFPETSYDSDQRPEVATFMAPRRRGPGHHLHPRRRRRGRLHHHEGRLRQCRRRHLHRPARLRDAGGR